MAVLREVTTRFKFDTDKKGVAKFERTMKGMTRRTRGLARMFGVTLGAAGVVAMGRLGFSVERAQFNMQRLAGMTKEQVNAQLEAVQKNLDGIKKGLGETVTGKNFFTAGAEFFRAFGKGEQQMAAFQQTFAVAAKLSLATGKNVNSLFASITQGIKSGDLGFLGDLGITEVQIRNLQDQLGAIDPSAAFTSAVGMGQRMNTVLGIIQSRSGQINKELKDFPVAILEGEKAAAKMQQSMQNLAKTMQTLLVPVLKNLNILLDKLVETSKRAETQGAGTLLTAAVPDILLPRKASELASRQPSKKTGPSAFSIIFNQTNNIKSTDTEGVGNEVAKQSQKMLQDANRDLPQTENR